MIHNYISKYIFSLLDSVYYKNLKKLYNENLNKIFHYPKISIFKPEYFIYSTFYFNYLFLYYITNKNFILYTLFLHSAYISELIYEQLIFKYNYLPTNNINFLKNTSRLLFIYFVFFKLYFIRAHFFNKIVLLSIPTIFYILHNINNIYTERLISIEDKNKIFDHYLKILIISPNKDFIQYIVKKTDFFNYPNFLCCLNLLLLFFL